MTGPMGREELRGKKPSSSLCREAGCPELYTVSFTAVNGTKLSYYCRVTDRIPGNMSKCPKDEERA